MPSRPKRAAPTPRSTSPRSGWCATTCVPTRRCSGSALEVPVATQPVPRLPVRRDAVVEVGLVARIGTACGHEVVEADPVAYAFRPPVEGVAELCQVLVHLALDTEVDERQPLRCATRDLVHRRVPHLDVDVGRR